MSESNHKGERIAKVIARAGVCSRRDAEKLIASGKVAVNGQIIDSAALNVTSSDIIKVNGKLISVAEAARVFLYHKPAGLVTSHKDEQGRPTVFENLPAGLPRVVSVGRLDLNTEGLLILTNDGGLSRYMELPATGLKRSYRVRVRGDVDQGRLDRLAQGVEIEGVHYRPILAKLQKSGNNSWIDVTLQEGKNREIRRVMAYLGLEVSRLIRVSYGPFTLGDLGLGTAREIPPETLKSLLPGYFA